MNLVRYNGNFVNCLDKIKEAKQRVATAREGMRDRIALGPDSHYKKKGCWHPEGTVKIGGVLYWCLPEFAPTTNYPQETLEANKRGAYLDLTNPEIVSPSGIPFIELIPEIAEKDKERPPYKRRVLIPEIQKTFPHATASLDKVDIALFLARRPNLAKRYGNFLNERCSIPSTTLFQIEDDCNNVGAGFWLDRLERGDDSDLYGDRDFSGDGGSLFEVAKRRTGAEPKRIAEGDSKKIFVYKPSDLRILREVRKGDLAPRVLEKIIKRFH